MRQTVLTEESQAAGMGKQPSTPIVLHARQCPICGSSSDEEVAPARVDFDTLDGFAFASRKAPEYMHWRLVCCANCDLIYASPAPDPRDLASLYRDADFGSAREASHAARTYGRLLPRAVSALPSRHAALDIGAGDGAFLKELLSSGFEHVLGLEPSLTAIAAGDPSIRPLLRQGIFQCDLFPPSSFDLVTCFQTIEHLSEPLEVCREIHKLLRPGGAILLVAHNRRAMSAKLLRRRSPIFDIEHLQLFSRRSLQQLLIGGGFRNVRIEPLINRYPVQYWCSLLPLPQRIKPLILRFLRFSRMGNIVVPLPAGNLVALGYK